MTIDEELAHLDDAIRRLKVEYDIYFGGGSKKAPAELEWRVSSLVKRLSDSKKLTFSQRFRYNAMVERYAIFSDLWRQKLRIKEEGYRRPQDALLGIRGMHEDDSEETAVPRSCSAVLTFGQSDELENVRELYNVLDHARAISGRAPGDGSLDSFTAFLRAKTKQIQERYNCLAVRYTVQVDDGRVRITAKPSQ